MDFRNEPHRPVPKYREKRPNRKKKKLETFKGVTIPPRKVRGKISKTDYNKALEMYGEYCHICGDPQIDMHHLVFRSQGSSGKYRNLLPLCKFHHRLAHSSFEFAEGLRQQRQDICGPNYFKDKYSLWKEGLISSPEDDKYEKYMKSEEVKAIEKIREEQD